MTIPLLACGVALLFSGTAGACEVTAASHHGVLGSDHISWESVYVQDCSSPSRVDLATALPAGTVLTSTGDVETVTDDDGRVVALMLGDGRTRSQFRVPLSGRGVLGAPLADVPAVQRVTMHGGFLQPDTTLGVQSHVAYRAQEGITRKMRRQTDRELGAKRMRLEDQALYLIVDERTRRAGLVGEIRPHEEKPRGALIPVVAIFAGVVGMLGLTVRSLTEAVRREQNAVWIERNIGKPDPPGAEED